MLRSKNPSTDWREVFSKATHGHAPPAQEAIDASRAEGREFLDHGIVFPGAEVLDLGCGNGRQLFGLLDKGLGSYVGADPVRESIDFCDSHIFPLVEGARFIHLDVLNEFYNPKGKMLPEQVVLPFPDRSFDSVIAGSVFTHLGNIEVCSRQLGEIARVLKPRGKSFSSWFRNPPNPLSSDRMRSVFREGDIREIVAERFDIFHSRGGAKAEFHDQWCLFSQKR
ncbi:MAG: class I SAM-dependent methyltransferase [Elusimicrobia bacterium]|nr:class I SAM-dependent methyltransferase [Elusimicrobiota bacterium]